MKEAFYFSHDYNARNDERVLELRAEFGAEGYGVFWMLIETMADSSDSRIDCNLLAGLSLSYGLAKAKLCLIIEKCVEIGLFKKDGDFIYSKRLLDHKDFRKERSESGKKGALKRWPVKESIAEPSLSHSSPNAKERKGKDRIEKDIKEKVIKPPPNLEDVKAYFSTNGYTEDAATKFFNYYDVADWKDGKGDKVRNWKQKAQSVWFREEYKIKPKFELQYNRTFSLDD